MNRLRFLFLVSLGFLFLVPSTMATTGGPDAFGYSWRDSFDGAPYSWTNISGTGTNLLLGDDTLSGAQTLGFNFDFYGTTYTDVYVCANGFISFISSGCAWTNASVPIAGVPNAAIFALWDDHRPNLGGAVYFQSFGGSGAVIQWDAVPSPGSVDPKTFQIVLFPDGRILVQYQTAGAQISSSTIGIEDEVGADGLQVLYNGTGTNGYALVDSSSIEFNPPVPLDCTGATALACDSTLTGESMGSSNVATFYPCGPGSWDGDEKIYELTIGVETNIDVTISNFGAQNLALFLLDSCSASTCLAGGGTTLSYDYLAPGTHYLLVDGQFPADSGPFDLDFQCNPSSTVNCGIVEDFEGVWSGASPPAGWSIVDNGSLADGWNDNDWHKYDDGAPQNNVARVYYSPIETQNEELILGPLDRSSYTGTTLQFWHYYDDISVGGDLAEVEISINGGTVWSPIASWDVDVTGVVESFDVSATADGQPDVRFRWKYTGNNDWWWKVDDVAVLGSASSGDCSGAQVIACPFLSSESTVGGTNTWNSYACSPDQWNGSEDIYEFTVGPGPTQIDVNISNFGGSNLSGFLISGCDPCGCITSGTVFSAIVTAGTYHLIVDGMEPADDTPYDIQIDCNDPCSIIPELSCNIPTGGNNGDDANNIETPCIASAGPEEIHRLEFSGPISTNITISMPDPDFDHVLYVLDDCTDPTSCVASADTGDIILTSTSDPQVWFIVVDGKTAADVGPYANLTAECPLPDTLDCGSATPISCGSTTPGNTIGAGNDSIGYLGFNGTFLGSDTIYQLTLVAPTNIDIYLEGFSPRTMRAFLLPDTVPSCSVNNVLDGGQEIHQDNLPAGDYWIVVDGRIPTDDGAFSLRVVCNTPATTAPCAGLCPSPHVFEDFEGGWTSASPPAGWTLTDGGSLGTPWDNNDWHPYAEGGTQGQVARVYYSPVESQNEDLILGPVNLSAETGSTLDYWHDYDDFSDATDTATVDISTNGGTVWSNLATYAGADAGGLVSIDISGIADGQPDVRVRFNYVGDNDWHWKIDDVQICVDAPPSGTIDCASPTIVACDNQYAGDTSAGGLSNGANAYNCGNNTYDGNEQVFELTLASETLVEVVLSGLGTSEMDVFILDSCEPCACIDGGDDDAKGALDPGTYYIVVDGYAVGDNGPFLLDVNCTSCIDPGFTNRWTACENPVAPTTTAMTQAQEWNFDDCDWCRGPGSCPTTASCTFQMYIVAECGTEMHLPLYDNESATISITEVLSGTPMWLEANSTSGWSDSGFTISWEDCSGTNPNWDLETTDISFDGSPTLCGIYRAEFQDWGGFIWDLFSNCSGTNTPDFTIYDNYCDALAAYDPFPSLSISNVNVTGTCPNYTVDYTISNTGCGVSGSVVYVDSTLGGSNSQVVPPVAPGTPYNGSVNLSVQSSGPGVIRVFADFYEEIEECLEAGTVTGCSLSGGNFFASAAINCPCAIPLFENGQVVDSSCPAGSSLSWDAPVFYGPSAAGHVDIYRSTVSYADAIDPAQVATNFIAWDQTGTTYDDNTTLAGVTYFYVLRAHEWPDVAPATCLKSTHNDEGLFTDQFVTFTDNLGHGLKPYDIANDLRAWEEPSGDVHIYWDTVTSSTNTTHWHCYRSVDPSLGSVPAINWSIPHADPGGLPDTMPVKEWIDTASGPVSFYDVRSSNDCEDIAPQFLTATISSDSPVCDGSGMVTFDGIVSGGAPPYVYSWDFGDGVGTSTVEDPSYVFGVPPPYSRTVTLNVSDATLPTNQVAVANSVVFFGPAVTGTFGSINNAGFSVDFTATPGGGTGSYDFNWDFGDGNSATIQNPTHVFSGSGPWNVSLTVTDSTTGCGAFDSQSVSPTP